MSRIREEAVQKVTGRAKYTSDISLPGMAWGKALGSPFAHARIIQIDTKEAAALPGVLAVITADDFNVYAGEVINDQPNLASGKVRHQGEPVAAVAAVDATTAEEALSLIRVDYEPLPAVADLDAALAPDATLVHETLPPDAPSHLVSGSNMIHSLTYERGDVESGFADADEVYEDEFRFPRVHHYPMETDAVVAEVNDEGVTIWSTTQNPFQVQEIVAGAFGLHFSQVRSIVSYIGDGFGGRAGQQAVLAVALARQAGVPVKLVSSLAENMAAVRRPSLKARLKTGVKRDGTLVARTLEVWFDIGAYTRRSPWIAEMAVARFLAGYRCPNARVDAHCVFTNTASCSTYRSPGAATVGWARETQFNIIAEKLGIDPVEFRLRNLLERGEEGTLAGTRPMDSDLPGDMRKLAEASDWKASLGPERGKGVAAIVHAASAGPPASAIVKLRTDGRLTVVCSGIEMGQGIYTAMRKISSLETGIPIQDVQVNSTVDTASSPFDAGTGGSRGTTVTGLAVQMAARDVKEQLIEIAARQLNTEASSIEITNGMVLAGEATMSIAEVLQQHFTAIIVQQWAPGIVSQTSGVSRSAHPQGRGEIIGRGIIAPGFDAGRLDLKPAFWETGMGEAEVEIDQETGLVKVVRYVGLGDAGRVFDEQLAEGQIEGAAMQALGHTLGEEMLYDPEGQLINSTLMDYRVTMVEDTPDQFEALLVENGDGVGAFGSRGIGQVHTAVIAPAVTNAIAQLTGVYMHELPITPYRLWEALQKRGKQ